MSERDDGGGAFPCGLSVRSDGHIDQYPWDGMSLRDYFAAKAMQALIASNEEELNYSTRAHAAYRQADAMLTARKA